MRRVLFYRLYDVVPTRLAELEEEARAFTRSRAWRGDAFWLADENTTELFAMEYFRHLRNEEGPTLSAAGFLRLLGDETDAIATLYFLNDISQRFHGRALLKTKKTLSPNCATSTFARDACPQACPSKMCWRRGP